MPRYVQKQPENGNFGCHVPLILNLKRALINLFILSGKKVVSIPFMKVDFDTVDLLLKFRGTLLGPQCYIRQNRLH